MSSTGNDSVTKNDSISTAFVTISRIVSFEILLFKCLYSKQAKSVCMPSSLLISSFEKHKPGMRPRFFIQKIAQKEPEKKIPSTQAKPTNLSAKVLSAPIHLNAHSALRATDGIF
jgi:hypothetical protein